MILISSRIFARTINPEDVPRIQEVFVVRVKHPNSPRPDSWLTQDREEGGIRVFATKEEAQACIDGEPARIRAQQKEAASKEYSTARRRWMEVNRKLKKCNQEADEAADGSKDAFSGELDELEDKLRDAQIQLDAAYDTAIAAGVEFKS